jgi:uncharacterized protein (TIGR02996 family)
MNLHEIFQKICENPEDDGLRLEYARQIEPSDPAHAELIRFQIELAADRRRGARMYGDEAKEVSLLERNRSRWAHDIAKYSAHGETVQIEFERGFPTLIRMHPELFIEYADLVFRLAPLRHIDFIKPYDENGELVMDEHGHPAHLPMERLLACPQLSRLDSIGFVNVDLVPSSPGQPGDVAKLARCPYLTRCVFLNFAFTVVGRRAFRELAEGELTGKMLVVVSPLDAGERRVHDIEVGMGEYVDIVFDDEWKAVEQRLGYIPWLHPSHNGVNRFDARWHLEHGKVPKYPPGSPQQPEWYAIPREYVSRSY